MSSSRKSSRATNLTSPGTYNPPNAYPSSLILRWNGQSWKQVASPNAAAPPPAVYQVYNELRAVGGATANDLWAVGTAGNQALALHWNGTRWTIVPAPGVGYEQNFLNGIVAVSGRDVFAVGLSQTESFFGEGGSQDFPDTLIEHWDGTRWSIVPSPSPVAGNSGLAGVAVAGTTAWSVGEAGGLPLVEENPSP